MNTKRLRITPNRELLDAVDKARDVVILHQEFGRYSGNYYDIQNEIINIISKNRYFISTLDFKYLSDVHTESYGLLLTRMASMYDTPPADVFEKIVKCVALNNGMEFKHGTKPGEVQIWWSWPTNAYKVCILMGPAHWKAPISKLVARDGDHAILFRVRDFFF